MLIKKYIITEEQSLYNQSIDTYKDIKDLESEISETKEENKTIGIYHKNYIVNINHINQLKTRIKHYKFKQLKIDIKLNIIKTDNEDVKKSLKAVLKRIQNIND